MTDHEAESLVPFSLNISGKVSAAEAKEFYDRLLSIASTVGELSTSHEVAIAFNMTAIGKSYRKGRFNLEDNGGLAPPYKDMTDSELEVSLFHLGNNIRASRRELGFSQAAVALDAGISQSYLSQIELAKTPYGLKRPSYEAIIGIAKALGTEELTLLEQAGYDVAGLRDASES